MSYELILSSRLKNCLTTILELEHALGRTEMGKLMQKEFEVLKKVAGRLERVELSEDDVHRIERATERFLNELSNTTAGLLLIDNIDNKERVLH